MSDEQFPYKVKIIVQDFMPSNIFPEGEGALQFGSYTQYRRGECVQEHTLRLELSWDELGRIKELIQDMAKKRAQ